MSEITTTRCDCVGCSYESGNGEEFECLAILDSEGGEVASWDVCGVCVEKLRAIVPVPMRKVK